jgi:hypothetical protein
MWAARRNPDALPPFFKVWTPALATMSQPASPRSDRSDNHQTQPAAAAAITVDPVFDRPRDDGDSALDDGGTVTESTASLSSTVFNYRKVHGRTFQNFKDAEYWAPNDEKQNDGLDIQLVPVPTSTIPYLMAVCLSYHMTLLLHDDRLHLAPLENPQNVLDVGTGTGIWAM